MVHRAPHSRRSFVAALAVSAASGASAAATAIRGAPSGAEQGLTSGLIGKWDLFAWLHTGPSPKASNISLEVYYGATCPHCLNFFSESLSPLVEAKLPGEHVQLTLLPLVPHEQDLNLCGNQRRCAFALPSLCALEALSMPAPADSEEFRKASRFALCELQRTAVGSAFGYTPDTESKCSEQAGLRWDAHSDLRQCARGKRGVEILNGTKYKHRMEEVNARLGRVAKQEAPFVFLNGDVLVCNAPTWCDRIRKPEGDVQLEQPGSLLYVVCNLLDSPPDICKTVLQPAMPAFATTAPRACESCDEVGAFRWHRGSGAGLRGQPLPLLALAAVAVSAGLAVVRAGWRRSNAYGAVGSTEDLSAAA